MAYELSRLWGMLRFGVGEDVGSQTATPNLSSAFVFETSGAVWMARFVAPVGQSSATLTLYVYVVSVTGTPDFQMEVRKAYQGSGDIDRPETAGSNLASSPSTLSLSSADNGTWKSLSCTVSLTQGNGYFLVVKNTHGTPASNHATIAYRGALDAMMAMPSSLSYGIATGHSADGFATDPTLNVGSGNGSAVLKFSDGNLLGFPYVAAGSAHANNTNSRGNRVQFAGDVVVSGLAWFGALNTAMSGMGIYETDGTEIVLAAGDIATENRGGVYRFAPVTLTGGVSYDLVCKFASNSTAGTLYTMGQAEGSLPADVLACRPASIGYVDGTVGSMTLDTSQIMALALIIDSIPAAAGGGGLMISNPMRGGVI